MKLAIMTKSTFFVEEDKILTSLFDEGMDNLHLFKPGSSPMYSERLLTLLARRLPYARLRFTTIITSSRNTTWPAIHIDNPLASSTRWIQGQVQPHLHRPLSMLKEMKKKSNYVFLKNIFDCIEFKDEKSSFSTAAAEEIAAKARTHRQERYMLWEA